jgi:hypothetical protein
MLNLQIDGSLMELLNAHTSKSASRRSPTDFVNPDACRREYLESLVRNRYEQLHPDDTFDDLKRRARFSKDDKGLLRDWLAVTAACSGGSLL